MPAWATYLSGGLNTAGKILKKIEDLTKQIPKKQPKPVPIPPIRGTKIDTDTKRPPKPGVVTFNAAMEAVESVLAPYNGYDTRKTLEKNAEELAKDILKSFLTKDDSQQRDEIYDAMAEKILSQKHPRLRGNFFINRRL